MGRKLGQQVLFDIKEWWEEEWIGMPEYVQTNLTPFRTLYIHFENQTDVDDFAKLVNQKITSKTKYIWYPELREIPARDKRYIDEERSGE
ncbi:MAG TPA: hypothetical protein PLI22_03850 [Caldisericia bacterium]|nr:hypothetical protein [Caldisericia bacterium]